ncbi:MAG: LysM peptidoglycan-binding domain-containing protein [Acidimicrobiales bacterium]|nr:LysM peptidoglycan-binding domain-containing protein [Acidimicrobiales bacterium]
MVALLTSDPIYTLPRRSLEAPTPNARRPRPRHLHALPAPKPVPGVVSPGVDAGIGDHSSAAIPQQSKASAHSQAIVLALVVSAAFVLVSAFGALQGAPPESGWDQLNKPAAAPPAPQGSGEAVMVVKPGDTLWGIAAVVAPGEDRRKVVQKLAERNGGSTIWAGQPLVIPAELANL